MRAFRKWIAFIKKNFIMSLSQGGFKISQKQICGIYMLQNKINGKKYIGQSIDIKYRYNNHIHESYGANVDKSAYNMAIHKAIRKYGINNFDLIVLEECNREKLDDREMYWIEYFDTYNDGYNQTIGGGAVKNKINTEKVFDLWDQEMSIDEIHKTTGYGKHSIIRNLEVYKNYSSQESRKRGRGIAQMKTCKKIFQYSINGEYLREFDSIKEAEEKTGTRHNDISSCIHGDQMSANGFRWSLEKKENLGPYMATMTNKKKKVDKYSLENEYLETYDSITAAAKSVQQKGLSGVIDACNKQKIYKNYRWKWHDEVA